MGAHYDSPADPPPVTRERSTYLTDSEAASFCTVFGDGLDSGMGYARIIDMLERQGYDRKVVDRLRSAILEDGDMLGESLARFGLLDPVARKLIYVAEQQGRLPSTFKDLGHYYGQRHTRRKELVSSFAEPWILIALGFILARNIFTSDLEELTQNADVVANLMPILIQSSLEIGIFACISGFTAFAFLNLPVDMRLRSVAYRLWIDLPLPFINNAARLNSISIFCRYTEKSITSGLTVHRALALAAEAANNPGIERRIPAAQNIIQQGETLATALYESEALPREVVEYIDVGEESGRLEERLADLAERYEEESKSAFQKSMTAFVYVMRMVVVVVVVILLLLALSEILSDGINL